MVLHRPVELAGIIGIWRRHAKAIFDAFRWPDYHAARHASTVSAPLFVSRFASVFFLFWRSRIDRSGGVEQGARTHFWPHGVRGRHSPRRIHGGTCLGQRMDRTSRRRLGPADRALRVVGTRRCRDCRNFSRGTGGRPSGLCRHVSLRGRNTPVRLADAAICVDRRWSCSSCPTFLMGGTLARCWCAESRGMRRNSERACRASTGSTRRARLPEHSRRDFFFCLRSACGARWESLVALESAQWERWR